MGQGRGFFFFFFLPFFLITTIARADLPNNEIPRDILSFYDRAHFQHPYFTPAHQQASMPLNHLGLKVTHRPLQDPYPTDAEMDPFVGIFNWISPGQKVPDPARHCAWLDGQIQKGRKVVLWGERWMIPGSEKGLTAMLPECEALMKRVGAEYAGEYTNDPFYMEVTYKDPAVEYERKFFLNERVDYRWYKPQPGIRPYLKIKRRDWAGGESAMVFTSSVGGFAAATTIVFEDQDLHRQQWRINPFVFFKEAFALKDRPIPDATTINGRRIFYSHIDGDGIFNISQFDQKSYSGEVVLNEVLKKYPTLPVTVSIITGYLDLKEFNGERGMKLYRDLFSQFNVEPASHGYAHPLVWRTGKLALQVPGYDYTPAKEVTYSLSRLNDLLRKFDNPKRAELFLWTGDCLPNHEALESSAHARILNMNGGDSLYDSYHSSRGYLAALGLKHPDGLWQTYASAPSEIVYTNIWKGPYYGYRRVIETFKNTEEPQRLKPINIYYHFFSAEKLAGLKALAEAYEYALSQNIHAVTAQDYAEIVRGFVDARLFALPDGGTEIRNSGALRTLRLDDASRSVDMARSRGVIGFKRERGALYVFLDEGQTHRVYWTNDKSPIPHFSEASFDVREWKGDLSHIRFSKRGWLKSEALIGGLHPKAKYRIESNGESQTVQTDARGDLKISFRDVEGDGPYRPVTIDFASF